VVQGGAAESRGFCQSRLFAPCRNCAKMIHGELGFMNQDQGEKRAPSQACDTSAPKAMRIESEESWACAKCSNVNFAGRTVCNMRFCKALKPGTPEPPEALPWICPGCGNENYATRVFCNLRKCQQARPGATFQEIQQAMRQGGASQPSSRPQPSITADTVGSWHCGGCGTVNFPGRTHCRLIKCGCPRQEVDAGQVGAFSAAAGQVGAFGSGFYPPAPSNPPTGQAPPDGAWVCIACQNINFPTRTSCNGKTCGMPRCEIDGGPPAQGALTNNLNPLPVISSAPEGSWICSCCQNENYPHRSTCNKRGCGLPKPMA